MEEQQEDMQKPVCLIENTSAGELQVNQKALGILNSITQPVVVVSIVGMCHTGKSYLMNRLAGKHTGFSVHSTVQSEKGIWMWCLPHPHRDDQTLVLLDTNGFGEVHKGDRAHDTWIFSLAVLLSSTLVYNSMGTINNEALMNLHYVTELTKHIKVKSITEKEDVTAAEFIHFFPNFVWAVRDFTLDLRTEGLAITADQYLENSLKMKTGNSRHVAHSNNSRECIRNYFPTRKCFMFNLPASKVKMRIIEQLVDANLDPAFIRQTQDFCSYILKQSKEKTITGGYTVTGQMLGNLVATYMEAIRSGNVPCLEKAVAGLSQIKNLTGEQVSLGLNRLLLGEQGEKKKLFGPKPFLGSAAGPIPRKFTHQWTPPDKGSAAVPSSHPSSFVPHPQKFTHQRTPPDKPARETQAITSPAPCFPDENPFVAMQKPMCLIENTSAGELQVNQKALDILNSITQPVVVVAIVGMYRTGKSYLMNRLAGKQTGFCLGSTIQSETKGIWMWCVPHPRRENHTLVLLDTEGLGDVEKGDQANDTWIFALAVLLSSTLVYNSMGTINNEAVMSLHYVTEITQHIKVKSTRKGEEMPSDYIPFFPTFVWAVRDFTLELKIEGKDVTADMYLENSLKLKKSALKTVEVSNNARECIRNYFPERKCFVFDQPGSKEMLKSLERLGDSELDPQFLKQTSAFCNYIFSHSKEKTIKGGIKVTGRMLGNLAVMYVEAIRSGTVLCLENAVMAVSQVENSVAVEESVALYRQLLEERVKLHTETQEVLSRAHKDCLKKALQHFLNNSFKDKNKKYQKELMERVKEVYERKCVENEEMSQNHCTALLLQLEKHIDMDPEESYLKPGGYKRFKEQLDNIVKLYKNKPVKGVKAEEVLDNYLRDKNRLGVTILAADKNLTEQQKRLEAQKAQLEEEKQKAEAAREQQRVLEETMKDRERAYEENERQLVEKMLVAQKCFHAETKSVMQQRLQEQRALLEEGYKQKAEQLNREIEQLQEKIASPKKSSGGCVLS